MPGCSASRVRRGPTVGGAGCRVTQPKLIAHRTIGCMAEIARVPFRGYLTRRLTGGTRQIGGRRDLCYRLPAVSGTCSRSSIPITTDPRGTSRARPWPAAAGTGVVAAGTRQRLAAALGLVTGPASARGDSIERLVPRLPSPIALGRSVRVIAGTAGATGRFSARVPQRAAARRIPRRSASIEDWTGWRSRRHRGLCCPTSTVSHPNKSDATVCQRSQRRES
jgi:hypothetical protein